MDGTGTTFAQAQFGVADLEDRRLNHRLVDVAEQLAAHPGETFPKRFHEPADLEEVYRLMAHERVTHAAVLRRTRRPRGRGCGRRRTWSCASTTRPSSTSRA